MQHISDKDSTDTHDIFIADAGSNYIDFATLFLCVIVVMLEVFLRLMLHILFFSLSHFYLTSIPLSVNAPSLSLRPSGGGESAATRMTSTPTPPTSPNPSPEVIPHP